MLTLFWDYSNISAVPFIKTSFCLFFGLFTKY